MSGDKKNRTVVAVGLAVDVDHDGDVVVALTHHCGCCRTLVFLKPGQVDGLVELLRFAEAQGRARKAGALPEIGAAAGRA
jgi:hypothetical protein